MPAKMLFKHPVADLFILLQRREEWLTKLRMMENRTKGDVQNLTRVKILEQTGQLRITK